MANLSDNYVHPDICRELYAAGVTANVPMKWRIHPEGLCQAYSPNFDPDNLYANVAGQLNIPGVVGPYEELPAYSLLEIMSAVPGIWINRNGRVWEVCADHNYSLDMVTAQSLPDACAMMVQRMISFSYRIRRPQAMLEHINNAILNKGVKAR